MKRGPKEKPAIFKILAGNPGKRPIKPTFQPAGQATMPDGLGEHGQRAWRELESILIPLGLLTPADAGMAFLLCAAWDDYHVASAKIATEGHVTAAKRAGGLQRVSRWLGIRDAAIERIRKLSVEFGLSPAARVGLHITPPAADSLAEYR